VRGRLYCHLEASWHEIWCPNCRGTYIEWLRRLIGLDKD
jgi:hypothetical protein